MARRGCTEAGRGRDRGRKSQRPAVIKASQIKKNEVYEIDVPDWGLRKGNPVEVIEGVARLPHPSCAVARRDAGS